MKAWRGQDGGVVLEMDPQTAQLVADRLRYSSRPGVWMARDVIIGALDGSGVATMSEWRPIETCPKDGTTFLAWCPRNNVHRVVAAWFDGERVWHRGTNRLRDHAGRNIKASHWMPRPEEPLGINRHRARAWHPRNGDGVPAEGGA